MTDARQAAPVQPRNLYFTEFNEAPAVKKFDCGNQGLNEFLMTEEVSDYEAEHYGRTTLAWHTDPHDLVGFYTIAPASLHCTKAKRTPKIRPSYSFTHYPALLIGRLAVDDRWQGRGIGRLLVNRIMAHALRSRDYPFRLVMLNAEPGSIEFYERMGFVGRDHHMNRGRDKPLLYLDLVEFARAMGIPFGGGKWDGAEMRL